MAASDAERRVAQRRLNEVLGPENAQILMEELATKAILREEINALEDRLDLKLEALEHRLLATLNREISAQMRTFVVATVTSVIGSVITVGGLAVAAARFS